HRRASGCDARQGREEEGHAEDGEEKAGREGQAVAHEEVRSEEQVRGEEEAGPPEKSRASSRAQEVAPAWLPGPASHWPSWTCSSGTCRRTWRACARRRWRRGGAAPIWCCSLS